MTGAVKSTTGMNDKVRMCKVYWIPREDKYMWLYKKIIGLALDANKSLWNFDISGVDILMQYTEYESSYGGHYDWHTDIGNSNNSKRKLSISIQLSDSGEYDGGDLRFFNKLKANREQGCMTIFPSYLLHKVDPVVRGKRKCLILWLTGHPFK